MRPYHQRAVVSIDDGTDGKLNSLQPCNEDPKLTARKDVILEHRALVSEGAGASNKGPVHEQFQAGLLTYSGPMFGSTMRTPEKTSAAAEV